MAKKLADKPCLLCDEIFSPAHRQAKYCSTDCSNAARKPAKPVRTDTISKGVRDIEWTSETQPRNEKEIVQQSGADMREWIVKSWQAKAWEGYAKDNNGNLVSKTLWSCSARFAPNESYQASSALADALLKDVRRRSPKVRKIKPKQSGLMAEFGAWDVHVGQLSWAEECGQQGQDYDTNIALSDWDKALDNTVTRLGGWNFEKCAYVLGGDISHTENGYETSAGTRQDTDSRYAKVVRRINSTVSEQVGRLARDVAPVTVIVCPGNHDFITCFQMGEVLRAYFHGNKNVEVINTAQPRKYITWGRNLLGYTHGDKIKPADLPSIMAEEMAQDWGSCPFREVKTGHLHTEMSRELHSVLLRRARALCPPSAWAAKAGYVGNLRGMEGFAYDKTEGLIAQSRYSFPN